jgi:Ulp1 family protease
MKIKIWIVSLISDSITDRFPKLSIPQWLLQIAYSEETFQDPSQRSKNMMKKPIGHNNELEFHRSRNTTKRGESIPALTPKLQSAQPTLNASSTSHPNNNKANNSVQTSHRLNNKANNRVQWKISHYSKSSILNIFDNPEKFDSEEFQEFITHAGRLANKQISSLRDPNSQSHSDFCVAVACNQQICAVDLQSLLENNWLSDTIINFMGKVLQRKWRSIHVYSTHFMSTLLSDDTMNYTKVFRWHKNIHAKVQFLYIPIHVNLNHWMLCCLNFSKKEILLWNSSSMTSDNSKYLEALKKYINHVSKSFTASPANKNKKNQWKGTWSMGDKSISSPQQGNFDDCGVFTILNMVLLSSGVALTENSYSQFEINCRKTRERISQIIFQNIHWKGFATDDIKDKQWLMFINRMNESMSQNSWSWVNHTK